MGIQAVQPGVDLLALQHVLRGDRRAVGFFQDEEDGPVFVQCRSAVAAESLFDHLWTRGYRHLRRHNPNTLRVGAAD